MSGEELGEWRAFEHVFGPLTLHERIDHAGAGIAIVLAQLLGKRRPYRLEEFLPPWHEAPRPRQTVGDMIANIRRIQRRRPRRGLGS